MQRVKQFEAGPTETWLQWTFLHPALGRPAPGKLMLGEHLDLAGMEVSLNVLPPHVAMPFAHKHHAHEELYVFLEGRGEFLVDGELFPVQPGSCLRVAPEGSRAWRNVGEQPLVYIVIQARAEGTLVRGIEDGAITEAPVAWGAARPAG
jgi:mannose-6-phosphate isomerase-like protein (cupin superfamily)